MKFKLNERVKLNQEAETAYIAPHRMGQIATVIGHAGVLVRVRWDGEGTAWTSYHQDFLEVAK